MNNLHRFWLAYRKRRSRHQFAGFTLIELLVSMIIGTLITVALLSLVVELTDVNQKDVSRTETQRDMQAALNYIAQDLREAVFVYDGACLQGAGTITDATLFASSCPGLANTSLNLIPASLTAVTATDRSIPILAFWRADSLPDDLVQACRTNSNSLATTPLPTAVQNVPCISGRTYTLVIYSIVDNLTTSTSNVWQGRARLTRYQLTQFTSSTTDGNAQNAGYVDPLPNTTSNFQQWPYQLVNGAVVKAQTAQPTGTADVLVDFVDDTSIAPGTTASSAPGVQVAPGCPDPSVITPSDSAPFNPGNLRSFYACVRGKTLGAAATEQGVNQEALLVLTGNVAGRSGFPLTTGAGNTARLFPIQTRVLTRGIVNKSPK